MTNIEALEKAYKKISEALNEAYNDWESVINAEVFNEKASKQAKGKCEGLATARDIIAEVELSIMKEENK